jgi:hypothetical protein
MRNSRRLTTLWAFTACYRDSFTFFTVTRSSNHTLNLHKLTSNSSSTTNFPWLSPTDNWPNSRSRSTTDFLYSSVLLQRLALEFHSYNSSARTSQHRKNRFPDCSRGALPLSCLANSLDTDHIENTSPCNVGRLCVWTCLPSNGVFWIHGLMLSANPSKYISNGWICYW